MMLVTSYAWFSAVNSLAILSRCLQLVKVLKKFVCGMNLEHSV